MMADSLLNIGRRLQHELPRVVLLLFPGFITSAGLLLLAAGYVLPGQAETSLFTLNFIQTFALGVTVAKYGADFLVYAKLRPGHFAMVGKLLMNRSIPLSLAYGILMSVLHGTPEMLLLAAILPLEAYAIVVISELNLNRKQTRTFAINLFGYPLILVSIFLVNRIHAINETLIYAIFVMACCLKAGVAYRYRDRTTAMDVLSGSLDVPAQQLLNFLLFRMDQVLIMLGFFAGYDRVVSSANDYLLMAKFPEVTAGVIAALTPLLLPVFLGKDAGANHDAGFKNGGLLLLMSLAIAGLAALLLLIVSGRKDWQFYVWFAPFLLHCVLILPVNLMTYAGIRKGGMATINRWSLLSLSAGFMLVLLFISWSSFWIFALIVPVQLAIYLALSRMVSKSVLYG